MNQNLQVAVSNNESEEAIGDIKYEISLLNLELAKYKYLNQQIKSTEDQLSRSTVSRNKYSDELLKLYVRSIKVTNKGELKITFKSGLEMQAACRCTLASA